MKALIRSGGRVELRSVDAPEVEAPTEVLVEVQLAGICRTDLFVAAGELPAPDPMVLGHELVGCVVGLGAEVRGLSVGDRVTASPRLPCGVCPDCRLPTPGRCRAPRWLGIDLAGAFAERVRLPASVVVPVGEALGARQAAYVEPVAAALAVLKAGLSPHDQVLVLGEGRIALLCARVLRAHGFEQLSQGSATDAPACSFDAVIETVPTAAGFSRALELVRAGGTVVLKSRPPAPVPLDVRTAVSKELSFRAVEYGSFEEAVALLESRRIAVEDLLGEIYPLEAWADAFAVSRGESAKTFLRPDRVA